MALLCGTLAAAVVWPTVASAGLLVLVGMAAAAVGAAQPRRRPVTLGAVFTAAGVVLAGLFGASTGSLLVATGLGTVGYAAADRAADFQAVHRQTTPTVRVELAETAATTLVVLVVGCVAFLVSRTGPEGTPLAVLAVLTGGTASALAIARQSGSGR
nr:hypothetical protein [Halobaculum sp. YSMS11]